jgi:hypothetical protein
MQHFRSNPPSRQIAPRPLYVPTLTTVGACMSAAEAHSPKSGPSAKGLTQLRRLEAFMGARAVSPSALGRMVAKDPRLVFELRNGMSPRDGLADKITTLRILNGAQALPLFDLPSLLGRKRAAKEVGDQIESLIAFMDSLGGDPDLEDGGDDEPCGDANDLSYPEWHTRSRKTTSAGYEMSETAYTTEDDEDSDPAEDDGEDCCRAGDDNPVAGVSPGYDLSVRYGPLYGPEMGCEDDAEPARAPAFANDDSEMTSDFSRQPGWGA